MDSKGLQKSAIPLYHQLEIILRKRILSGQIQSGSPIPTERELAIEFKVSRPTVRQALTKLEDADLIRREQGRGTFVTTRIGGNSFKLHGSLDELFDFGAETYLKINSKTLITPSKQIRKDMKLAENEKVYLFEGFRYLRRSSRSRYLAYVPEAIGEKIDVEAIEGPFLITLVEKAALEQCQYALQVISADAASDELAATMQIQPGSPLLVIKRTYFTAEEEALETAINYFPAEVYKSVAKLVKMPSAGASKPT